MAADEVLRRLTDQARGSMADFVTISRGRVKLDLKKAAELGKLHLIKKLTDDGKGIRIELYDSKAALELIGKHHKLFVERSSLEGPDGGPIQHAVGAAVVVVPSKAGVDEWAQQASKHQAPKAE